ncbi:MAG: hypothetical protein ACI8UO_001502 [Verrucomicrobiales bacterium]|jgi:hypothetical protein
MKTIYLLATASLISAAAGADNPRWKLTDKDIARIDAEIEAFGLSDAPQISDAEKAKALTADTAAVVVKGGSVEVLNGLTHLKDLEELYVVIGEITEADLESLTAFKKLKRLTLGMASRYRLRNELWEPTGKLTSLEQLDIRCDP